MSAPSASPSRFGHARRGLGIGLTSLRDYGIVASFIALFVVLTFKSGVFLTKVNLFNVLDQNAANGIMACGGTLVLIAGGFDLSVGAIFALSGVIAAQSAAHINPTYALILGALSGLGVGILNGVVTTVGRINPIVGTLASSIVISLRSSRHSCSGAPSSAVTCSPRAGMQRPLDSQASGSAWSAAPPTPSPVFPQGSQA